MFHNLPLVCYRSCHHGLVLPCLTSVSPSVTLYISLKIWVSFHQQPSNFIGWLLSLSRSLFFWCLGQRSMSLWPWMWKCLPSCLQSSFLCKFVAFLSKKIWKFCSSSSKALTQLLHIFFFYWKLEVTIWPKLMKATLNSVLVQFS